METQEFKNIQQQYEANGIQSIMFMALVQWKKDMEAKMKRPSLDHIRNALLAIHLNHHFLCEVLILH